MAKKYSIVLDLDNTLICAEPSEEFNFAKYDEKMAKFAYYNMDGYYIVFERPHLQYFLDYIFKHFNVGIWTAASKDYALFIVENIIIGKYHPERKLDFLMWSYHCEWSTFLKGNKKTHSKQLSMLWNIHNFPHYNKNNTIIIDDYDDVYKYQKNNCVIAPKFEITWPNSESDIFLKQLIPELSKLQLRIDNGSSNLSPEINRNLEK